jgi:hypothetical protein
MYTDKKQKLKNIKECDNIKIHISTNFTLSVSFLIMFDTLLLRPSLNCNISLHLTKHMLLHLLYSKPTDALILNTLSHPHFKTTKSVLKCFVKTSLKNATCFGHYCMTILRGRLSYLVHYNFSACLLRPVAYSVCGCVLSAM